MLARLLDPGEPPWDVLVIGGGATGLGAAVEAASRGYRTALLEGHDFAKGTSSRSTKLVHGGVRYLQQGQRRRWSARRCASAAGCCATPRTWCATSPSWSRPTTGGRPPTTASASSSTTCSPAAWASAPRAGSPARRRCGRIPTLRAGGAARRRRLPRRPVRRRPAGDHPRPDPRRPRRRGGQLRRRRRAAQGGRRWSRRARVRDAETGEESEVARPGGDQRHRRLRRRPPAAGRSRRARRCWRRARGSHLVLDRRSCPATARSWSPTPTTAACSSPIPWHDRVVVGTTDTPGGRAVPASRARCRRRSSSCSTTRRAT